MVVILFNFCGIMVEGSLFPPCRGGPGSSGWFQNPNRGTGPMLHPRPARGGVGGRSQMPPSLPIGNVQLNHGCPNSHEMMFHGDGNEGYITRFDPNCQVPLPSRKSIPQPHYSFPFVPRALHAGCACVCVRAFVRAEVVSYPMCGYEGSSVGEARMC